MNLQLNKSALILIDLQKGFDDEEYWGGNRNNKNVEKNAGAILSIWRKVGLPLFHIVHSSNNPNSKLHKSNPGFQIKDEVKPIEGEPVIEKNVNSAFIGTDLKKYLDHLEVKDLVFVGLTTNHCVSTSVRMAADLSYNSFLVSDATATFDRIGINGEKYASEIIHQKTLKNLNKDYSTIINTKQLLDYVASKYLAPS